MHENAPMSRVAQTHVTTLFACGFACALALGFAVRLYGLAVHSIWFDEGCSLFVATAPDFDAAIRTEVHPPLSFLAFRALHALGAQSEAAFRFLTAFVSCVTLSIFARITMQAQLSRTASVASLALYAVCPFLVWFAHEIRMYAFLELGGVLLLHAVVRSDARAAWVSAPLGAAIACGSHYLGTITVMATIVALLLRAFMDPRTRRRSLQATLLVMLGAALWIPWIAMHLPDQRNSSWTGTGTLTLSAIAELPVRLYLVQLRFLSRSLVYLGGGLIAAACLAMAIDLLRSRRELRAQPLTVALASLVLGPIAGMVALSLLVEPRVAARYVICSSAPFFMLLTARSFRVLPRLGPAMIAALIAIGILSDVFLHERNLKDGYREACQDIVQSLEDDDEIVACSFTPDGYSEAPLVYYLTPKIGAEAAARIRSVRQASDVLDILANDSKRRVHLVARWTRFTSPCLQTVLSQCRVVSQSPVRETVQWFLLAARRP